MDSTNIIAILLFIIPGIIAEKISSRMDMPSSNARSEFGELINGILISLPIVAISSLLINGCYKFTIVDQFIQSFKEINFLIQFTTMAIFIAVLTGIILGLSKDKLIKLVNYIRADMFEKIKIDDKCCWRKTFLDDKRPRFLEVSINNEKHEGFADCYSLPNEEKEIVLYIPENWECYPELRESIKRVEKTYINLEKNIVIKDYDILEHNKINDLLIESQKN